MNRKQNNDYKLDRIDKHYLYKEFQNILNLEKGFFFTVKRMLIKPGESVREFLFSNREKYVKPIIFLIIGSVIFSLIISFLDIKMSFFNIDKVSFLKGKIQAKEIGDWTQNNLGYSQLIMAVFIGVWISIFFKKCKYNFYEILILQSFILGEAFLIYGTFILLGALFKSYVIVFIGSLVYFIYIIWGVGQFFGEKNFLNYIKSLLAYFLGNFTYLLILTLLGFLLKLI